MSVARTILSLTVGRALARVVGVHHSGPTRVGRRGFVRNATLGSVGVLSTLGGGAKRPRAKILFTLSGR